MDYEQDRKNVAAMDARNQYDAQNVLKQRVATSETYSTPLLRGGMGADTRRPIRQRINDARNQADSAIRRAEAAEHARQIIERHPEFADLLDALNEF